MSRLTALRALSENKFLAKSVTLLTPSAEMGNDYNAKDSIMSEPISDMGFQGTGGPWWVWIIIAGVVVILCACCGLGVYRHKKKLQQEQQGSDGLDEPLVTDSPLIA